MHELWKPFDEMSPDDLVALLEQLWIGNDDQVCGGIEEGEPIREAFVEWAQTERPGHAEDTHLLVIKPVDVALCAIARQYATEPYTAEDVVRFLAPLCRTTSFTGWETCVVYGRLAGER